MNANEAREFCHAYLDGQLSAETKTAIDTMLANDAELKRYYEEQRAFLAALHSRSRAVEAPSGLEDGLRARLKAARAEPKISSLPSQSVAEANPFRRRWMMYAAGLLLTVGAAGGLYWSMREECPYMVACVNEHRLVLEGKGTFNSKSSDAAKLAQWVGAEVQTAGLKALPTGAEFGMKLEGAGSVEFKSLRQWGSPGGVFISYINEKNTRVTILVQRWPEEEPEDFNRMQIENRTYWATRHKGFGVASWKSPDDKLVISVVTPESKTATLEIAEKVRKELDAQIPRSEKIAFLQGFQE
jgi:hypothetical protein